jgi:Protein of unknown function (DUF1552)
VTKSRKSQIARRTFLAGAGTTGLALPFLESVPERSAFAQDEDARFAFFICAANGVAQQYQDEPERFWPKQAGPLTRAQMTAESAERCTGLLADHAERLLIVSGMRYHGPTNGDNHGIGHVNCLTGLPHNGVGGTQVSSSGPSVDWAITTRAGGRDPLNTYAGLKSGYIDDRLSFKAAGALVAAEADPHKVYLQIAGLLDPSGSASAAANELARRRKSVNDLVREDLKALLGDARVSAVDKQRLDMHLTSIRDFEGEIGEMACNGGGLNLTEIESIGAKGFIEDVARLQMQLVGVAFACNLTRAATLQWGTGGGDGTQYTVNGETLTNFHHISHRMHSDGGSGTPIEGAAEMHAQVDRIRMGTLKSMLDHWSQLSTPAGSLFDSAVAVWTTDVGIGPSSSHTQLPLIIAGSPGGKLLQGQHLKLPNFYNTSMLKSIMEACGVDSASFAESAGLSPLAEIMS